MDSKALRDVDPIALSLEVTRMVTDHIAGLADAVAPLRYIAPVGDPAKSVLSRLSAWARTGKGLTTKEVDDGIKTFWRVPFRLPHDVWLILRACEVRGSISRGALVDRHDLESLTGLPPHRRNARLPATKALEYLVSNGAFLG